jgi:uncharacterized protein
MAQSKIQQDRYTPYLRSGGELFRPLTTRFRHGQVVRVTPIRGTSFARVERQGQEELWYSHGRYLDYDGRRLDSEFFYHGADFNPFIEGNTTTQRSAVRTTERSSREETRLGAHNGDGRARIPSVPNGRFTQSVSVISHRAEGAETREYKASAVSEKLREAVLNRDLEGVLHFLKGGGNVNAPDGDGCTALVIAAAAGNTYLVSSLLEHGATDLDVALAIAAGMGHIDAMRLLLERGANADARDDEGTSIFMFAAEGGQAESARLLIEYGTDVNAQNSEGVTSLMIAARNNATHIARLLLRHGADIQATDTLGRTALCLAAEAGAAESVALLLGHGAEIETADHEGWTPLLHTVFRGHSVIVQCLLGKGANIHVRDSIGRNAAYWAAVGGHVGMLRLLLERGAEVDPMGDGMSVTVAALEDQTEMAMLLQEAGAFCGLLEAAMLGDLPMVRARVQEGEDIEKRDWDGHTPLAWAAIRGHADVVRFLAEAGADVNAHNHAGETPLILAAREGRTEVLKVLREQGADIRLRDHAGYTALTMARQRGHLESLRLLNALEMAA